MDIWISATSNKEGYLNLPPGIISRSHQLCSGLGQNLLKLICFSAILLNLKLKFGFLEQWTFQWTSNVGNVVREEEESAGVHTSKKRKSLRSLVPSPKYFAEKVRKSQQPNFATKVRKSWNEAKIYKKLGLLTTFLCNVGESETNNMFIRHLWCFFTTLWHIFKAIALPDKNQQSKFGSFRVLRL